MIRHIHHLILLLSFLGNGITELNAQKIHVPRSCETEVSSGGQLYRFFVLIKGSENITARVNHIYYWYYAGTLRSANGGIGGKLLHGPFQSFNEDLSLHESGRFRYGQKKGVWMQWYPDGRIQTRSKWKNGLLHGHSYCYSHDLSKCVVSVYRCGKLHGKQKTYQQGKLTAVKKFRDGTEVTGNNDSTTVKPGIWKRFCNIFVKKEKKNE